MPRPPVTGGLEHRSLAHLLRDRRLSMGLTLGQVATQVGTSISFLSDIERAKSWPSTPMLIALMGVYGLGIGPATWRQTA